MSMPFPPHTRCLLLLSIDMIYQLYYAQEEERGEENPEALLQCRT